MGCCASKKKEAKTDRTAGKGKESKPVMGSGEPDAATEVTQPTLASPGAPAEEAAAAPKEEPAKEEEAAPASKGVGGASAVMSGSKDAATDLSGASGAAAPDDPTAPNAPVPA